MKRIAFLDYVRLVACFLVMLVHASENFYGVLEGSEGGEMAGTTSYLATETDRLWVSIYDGFSRMAVPLFMIVSAFLLAPMKEDETSWRFYKKRFLRILPPMLVFMVLYSTLPLLWGQLDKETALFDLSHIPLNFPSLAGHLWFLYPLISIYLIIPIISPWLRKATAKEELFFICLFLLSSTIPYIHRFVSPEVWGECFWSEYHALWYFSGFLGYVIIAHYIHKHLKWDTRKRMTVGATMFIVGGLWTAGSFYLQATPGLPHVTPEIELGWSMCTINVAITTIGAFLMFSCIKRERAIVSDISQMSFGMYLMHIFWLGVAVGWLKPMLPTVAAIPAIAVVTYICSYLTTKLLSYLPGAYYWLGAKSK